MPTVFLKPLFQFFRFFRHDLSVMPVRGKQGKKKKWGGKLSLVTALTESLSTANRSFHPSSRLRRNHSGLSLALSAALTRLGRWRLTPGAGIPLIIQSTHSLLFLVSYHIDYNACCCCCCFAIISILFCERGSPRRVSGSGGSRNHRGLCARWQEKLEEGHGRRLFCLIGHTVDVCSGRACRSLFGSRLSILNWSFMLSISVWVMFVDICLGHVCLSILFGSCL